MITYPCTEQLFCMHAINYDTDYARGVKASMWYKHDISSTSWVVWVVWTPCISDFLLHSYNHAQNDILLTQPFEFSDLVRRWTADRVLFFWLSLSKIKIEMSNCFRNFLCDIVLLMTHPSQLQPCFDRRFMRYVISSPIFFRVTLLALGQSYDCPSASGVILKDMGKTDRYHTATKHNKTRTMCIFLVMHCTSKHSPDRAPYATATVTVRFRCNSAGGSLIFFSE